MLRVSFGRPLCRLSSLSGVLLLAACGKAAPPPAAPPPAAPPVSVAAAVEREITEADEFPGRISAVERVAVRARVNGYLQAIHFTPGTEVKRGDLLFEIDPRPFAARLAEAQAQRANTQAELTLARTELARHTRMLVDHATSRREHDAAGATVKSLEAALAANDAAIATARLNLDYTRITAPVAGRVGKDEVTVGNLVQGDAPDSPVLTTIVSVDPVHVSFEADEAAYLKYIGQNRQATLAVGVGLANEAGFPHEAALDFVDNQVDPMSGTVRMRARLANPERRFTPGLFARVRLSSSAAARRAVLVADRSIGTDQSKRFVLVVGKDNVATYREVKIGRIVDGLRVVEDGLASGEVIVVDGLQRVRPGSPVAPATVAMTTDGQAIAATPAPDAAAPQ